MKLILKLVLGFVAGTVAGFFTVFNYVFSDSSGLVGERIFTFVIVVVVYVILGMAAGFFFHGVRPLLSAAVVSTPALLILILYLLREPVFLLSLFYMVLTPLSAFAGAYLAKQLFRKRVSG